MDKVSVARYPRIVIQYCSKCKWQNRAVWYLQEIFQTFSDQVMDVSLQPIANVPGTFQILVIMKDNERPKIIYKRRFKKSTDPQDEPYYYDGFPDSQFLKLLLKRELNLETNLGHIERNDSVTLLQNDQSSIELKKPTECEPCKSQQ